MTRLSQALTAGSLLAAVLAFAAPQKPHPAAAPASNAVFSTSIQPFIAKNCLTCHSAKANTAGLNLEDYKDASALEKDRDRWETILSKVQTGEMPPKGMPKPAAGATKAFTDSVQAEFARLDSLIKPDPGHITAHRLNRAEYNNTVRDLLGVNYHAADDFPADDSGYGFDNIGDVLSLSPVLMEKYLTAAERISRIALYGEPAPKPTNFHKQPFLRRPPPPATFEGYDESGLSLPSAFNLLHEFPAEGEYLLKVTLNGQRPPGSEAVNLAVWLDGKQIQTFSIEQNDMEGQSRSFRTRLPKGEHLMSVSFLKQYEGLPARFNAPNPSKKPAPPGRGGRGGVGRGGAVVVPTPNDPNAVDAGDPNVPLVGDFNVPVVGGGRGGRGGRGGAANANVGNNPNPVSLAGRAEALDIGGPFDAKAEPPVESLKKIFTCGHPDGNHNEACPRKILSDFARRAYRRPVSPAEVTPLVALYAKVRAKGDSFNEGIAAAIQYVLVSPDFLFRVEKASAGIQPLGQYELASRLSYFLWSSMPDDELLRTAAQGRLRSAPVLDAQVRRMLKDPKSKALVENFAGQWLQIRNMDSVNPDWEHFLFDDLLRTSAKHETELFLASMIQEDRSILDMIDGKYTYLNERMARFYGIPGVTGPEFRKVDLAGNAQRSGILTQASVLTVSSYATRTSPVLRGKWILENILNTPPPPPPPNVPELQVAEVGASVSLRQQLEKHRSNAVCASCHSRMDPLGFGLENYNAIGEFRAEDGKFPIDASGKLPDGRTFTGSAGLKQVLMSDKEAFARCVTEKLMIYALGRGVERFDKPVIADVAKKAAPGQYRFSDLVIGIVHSMPFEMHRSEQVSTREGKDVRHS